MWPFHLDPRFALAGLVVGFLVGLTGVGGSAVLAPVLILLFAVKPSIAIGTDLLYSVPTRLVALGVHARMKTVDWRVTRWLIVGGAPGILAGVVAYGMLRTQMSNAAFENELRHAIGIAILLGCVGAGAMWIGRRQPRETDDEAPFSRPAAIAIGAFVGFLVALTSIGSGSIMLPLLILATPMLTLKRAIGSEIAFAAILVPLAAAAHLALGDTNVPMVVALLVGALPGAYLGGKLCGRIGERWLRPTVFGILAFAGWRLF